LSRSLAISSGSLSAGPINRLDAQVHSPAWALIQASNGIEWLQNAQGELLMQLYQENGSSSADVAEWRRAERIIHADGRGD